jgi:hypothetical protein
VNFTGGGTMYTMHNGDCGMCGGVGSIWADDADSVGEHATLEQPCPACSDHLSDGVPETIHDTWEGHDTVTVPVLSMADLVGVAS